MRRNKTLHIMNQTMDNKTEELLALYVYLYFEVASLDLWVHLSVAHVAISFNARGGECLMPSGSESSTRTKTVDSTK